MLTVASLIEVSRFIPESPRWLVYKGRVGVSLFVDLVPNLTERQQESQASRVLARFHAHGGDEHDPLIVFEMAQIRHALKLEKETSKNNNFLQILSTPGNLRRLRVIIAIAMFSQWRFVLLLTKVDLGAG